MKLKSSMALVAMGVGGTLMYQQIKNGNMKKWFKKMKKSTAIEDIENMM